jgi:hypothetical protein
MVKIHYEWNDMSCKNCSRYNKEGICDLNGKTNSYNLCKLFIPKRLEEKFRKMWLDCQQRWIVEGQN